MSSRRSNEAGRSDWARKGFLEPVEWKELMFKCKPDVLEKMPCFVTPYHYRLDWEIWIHVTAMGEHTGPSTPGFVRTLIQRILLGDMDAAALLRTSANELFAGGAPPTVMRTRFYLYNYSAASSLLSDGKWWHREPLPHLTRYHRPPFLSTDAHNLPRSDTNHHGVIRALANVGMPQRDWALFWLRSVCSLIERRLCFLCSCWECVAWGAHTCLSPPASLLPPSHHILIYPQTPRSPHDGLWSSSSACFSFSRPPSILTTLLYLNAIPKP